jgi:phosphoribosyl 1,2-cyclic phosphate phosphodiesterase
MSTLRFLGTGTSSGVPVLGCSCEVCTSADPRDRRLRTSAYATLDTGERLLIDCGTDFREQSLAARVFHADAVLVTHPHADHIGGLDDLRQVNFLMKRDIDVFGNAFAVSEIRERYGYIFRRTQEGGGKPRLVLHDVSAPFRVGNADIVPLPVMHGEVPILGFRIGALSYITDASFIPEETYRLLEGTEVLVLNALRPDRHPTHFSLPEALEAAARVSARETWLIHLTHHFMHARDDEKLPKGVHFAFDGLKAEF